MTTKSRSPDEIWRLYAPEGSDTVPAVPALSTAYKPPGVPCFAPLLATPADRSAEPPGRANLLRRALTSPWRLLVQNAGGPDGPVEHSCHAFGTATNAVNATAMGRMDRWSAASDASHGSIFNVDGLPERLAPDLAVATIYTTPHRAAAASRATDGDRRGGSNHDGASSSSSSRRWAPALLHRAATAAVAAPELPAQTCGGSQHSPRSRRRRLNDRSKRQAQSPEPPFGGEGPPSGRTEQLWNAHHPEISTRGVGGGGGNRPLALSPLPQPEPSQPPLATASLLPSETGLLGSLHHLLQLPDAFTQHSHQQQGAAPDPPPRATTASGSRAAADAAAPAPAAVISGGGSGPGRPPMATAAAATAVALRPGELRCDDVQNPMSFEYDPSLDPSLDQVDQQPRLQPQSSLQRQRGCTAQSHGTEASPAGPYRSCSASAPAGFATARGGYRDAEGAERQATSNAGGGTAETHRGDGGGAGGGDGDGDGDGDGVEVVASDGPFVVLELKGPRGTPSTRAAAAAAYLAGASASLAAPDAAAAAAGMSLTLRGRAASYFSKWHGVGDTLMPADHPIDVFWSWLGAFLSILAVAVLNQYLTPRVNLPLMIASFGASAVLLFGVPASKLAQPRNFMGGQVISAVVGVLVRLAFEPVHNLVWLSAALGMSLALAAMQVTRTVHPPGGASALIAASAPYIGPWYGFKFVLTVFFGCLAMLVVAVVVNNCSSRRTYPTYWWGR